MKPKLLRLMMVALFLATSARSQDSGFVDALLVHRQFPNRSMKPAPAPGRELILSVHERSLVNRERAETWEKVTTVATHELAGRLSKPNPLLSSARRQGWDLAFAYFSDHRAAVVRGEILDVEPDIAIGDRRTGEFSPAKASAASANPGATPDFDQGVRPMDFWSRFTTREPKDGFLADSYSQLKSAFALVSAQPGQPARVAILDIGFLKQHRAFPAAAEPAIEIADPKRPLSSGNPGEPYYPPKPAFNEVAHGTATSSILAGRAGTIAKSEHDPDIPQYFSGGNPRAVVVPIRIGHSVAAAPLPIYFSSVSDIAKGFDRAAVEKAEVISMSVGGTPSRLLAAAVNNAYHAGITIVCATGDYIRFKEVSFIRSPWYVVYPAAYANVMAVPGVTANEMTYGNPENETWTKKITLGSFGPIEKMQNAVAGWGPNMPWIALPDFDPTTTYPRDPWALPNGNWHTLDFNGGGTSCCTPQVAAAASLIVEHRRPELARMAEPWQKVEAVYAVLREAADKQKVPADALFFGNGFLKARDAVQRALPDPAKLTEHAAKNGFYWLRLLLSAFLPPPQPGDGSDQHFRRELALSLKQIMPEFNDPKDAHNRYSEAVTGALETELEQVVDQTEELQTWINRSITQKFAEPAARREFLELLLKQELSRTLRRFVETCLTRIPPGAPAAPAPAMV